MATSYNDRTAISATNFDTRILGGDAQLWGDKDVSWGDAKISWQGLPTSQSITNRTEPSTSFTIRTSP